MLRSRDAAQNHCRPSLRDGNSFRGTNGGVPGSSVPTPPCPPSSRGGDARHWLARCDWRGWIALVWVLWFGWLYTLMVLQTKFPQVLAWVRSALAVSGGDR